MSFQKVTFKKESFAHFPHICSHLKRRSVEENYDDNLKQLLKAAGGILTGNKQGDVGKWRRLWNQKEIALCFISQPSVNGKHHGELGREGVVNITVFVTR